MVRELAVSAIKIKMAAKVESPIISTFEYCFAAGLAFSVMHVSAEVKDEIRNLDDFKEIKRRTAELVSGADAFQTMEYGERLKSLLLNCRISGEMSEDARALFDTGFAGS